MVAVSDSIVIDAPVADVFAFMDDPENHVTVTPSLSEVRDIERLDNGGKRLDHTFRMAGVSLNGHLIERTHEEPSRMVFDMEGGLSGEIELAFEPAEGGTRLTYSAEYDIPNSVLGRVAAPFVRRYNERELRSTLENVRTAIEGES